MARRQQEGDDRKKAKEIGKRISQARKETGGMSQLELADLLGVSGRSVAAYETGEVIPYRFLKDLERVFGKEPAWFLHGEEATEIRDHQLDEIKSLLEEMRRDLSVLMERAP